MTAEAGCANLLKTESPEAFAEPFVRFFRSSGVVVTLLIPSVLTSEYLIVRAVWQILGTILLPSIKNRSMIFQVTTTTLLEQASCKMPASVILLLILVLPLIRAVE